MKQRQQQLINIITICEHDYDRETVYKTEHNKSTENICKWQYILGERNRKERSWRMREIKSKSYLKIES